METLVLGLLFLIVSALVCASLSAYIAGEKGYSSVIWFFLGLFLLIAGLIAAAGLPDRLSRLEKEVRSDPKMPGDDTSWVCSKCFRTNPGTEIECLKCRSKRRE
jgi:hypothetical protein